MPPSSCERPDASGDTQPTRPGRRGRTLARAWTPSLLAAAAVGLLFYWRWPSLNAFVTEIDYLEQFQRDFTAHYYPMSQQILHEPQPVLGYLYPAAFALLLVPLGQLPPDAASGVWLCIQLVALVALVMLSSRALVKLSPLASAIVSALVLTSVPALSNAKWGQVSVPLTAMILGSWLLLRRGRPKTAGALLGVAAAIKLFPVLFVVLFVAARAWRAVIAFAITFALLYAVLPAAALGLDAWIGFERAVLHGAAALQSMANANSQSLGAVLDRWYFLATDAIPPDLLTRTNRIAGFAGAAACVWWSTRLYRRPAAVAAGLPVVALFGAIPLVIGTAWPHYMAYLPACQAGLLFALFGTLRGAGASGGTNATRAYAATGVVLTALSTILTSLLIFDALGHWALYNGYGVLLVADLLLLAALGFAATAMRRRASPDDSTGQLAPSH